MRRHVVFDSRGAEQQLLRLSLRQFCSLDRNDRRLKRVRRGIMGPITGEWGAKALIIGIAGLAVVLFAIGSLGGDDYGLRALLVFGMAMSGVVLSIILSHLSRRSLIKRQSPEWILSQVAMMRNCPCCGYTLRGLEPADDGCTVCPECGAAWWLAKAEAAA